MTVKKKIVAFKKPPSLSQSVRSKNSQSVRPSVGHLTPSLDVLI